MIAVSPRGSAVLLIRSPLFDDVLSTRRTHKDAVRVDVQETHVSTSPPGETSAVQDVVRLSSHPLCGGYWVDTGPKKHSVSALSSTKMALSPLGLECASPNGNNVGCDVGGFEGSGGNIWRPATGGGIWGWVAPPRCRCYALG